MRRIAQILFMKRYRLSMYILKLVDKIVYLRIQPPPLASGFLGCFFCSTVRCTICTCINSPYPHTHTTDRKLFLWQVFFSFNRIHKFRNMEEACFFFPSVCLSILLPHYLFIYLPIFMYFYLSIYQYPYIYIYPSTFLSTYV